MEFSNQLLSLIKLLSLQIFVCVLTPCYSKLISVWSFLILACISHLKVYNEVEDFFWFRIFLYSNLGYRIKNHKWISATPKNFSCKLSCNTSLLTEKPLSIELCQCDETKSVYIHAIFHCNNFDLQNKLLENCSNDPFWNQNSWTLLHTII